MMVQLKFFITALAFLPALHMKMLSIRNSYDPGTCAKSNHGELILVKDLQDKDTILVCTEDKGVYTWKTTEGSKPPGEYFNPGYDCLDILNRNTKARDGFYWIDFHRSVPHKVWCDMTTDGGGYMLIGRMNDSVTWDVPSTNSTVEPLGLSQWSSSFGDVPILDFRIQVVSNGQYKKDKAHWSFRFRNKRSLKKLMMVNEGGCPYNLPGIGDISFVKNLMTEEIASKGFPCSAFGVYSHPSAKIGWSMMNSCLEKPCPNGFAYHRLLPMQFDFSGSFSFLAGNHSGSTDGSTAFFGCDKGKCCACYGPPGGSDIYCEKECQSKNGGTITKNVNALFWVRLNPPQRVWKKCMEYKTEENGQGIWYKLVGDRNIPVEGRCGKTEANANDGIVVVPDDVTADKVPHITGLLTYQKDSEVLRLRKSDSWTVMAEQKTVESLKLQLERMISELDTYTKSKITQLQSRISSSAPSQLESRISKLEERNRIRLRGTTYTNKGRVEVYHPSHGWGTVCDDDWDINDGQVVCRQLGFSGASAVFKNAQYGQGKGPILLDDLGCSGNENYIWDCSNYGGWNRHNCGHSEDASVVCA